MVHSRSSTELVAMAKEEEEAVKDVVLLSYWCSPYGHKVQIALREKGVEHEYKEEDIFEKSPRLLQSNPVYGKVPVLLHGGRTLCESGIILQYLDEAWSHAPALLPGDPYQRANARFWADYVDKKFNEAGMKVWKAPNDEARAEAAKELIGALKQLEGELGGKPYFSGEAFGYVDVTLIAFGSWLQVLGRMAGFSMEDECPQLQAWADRCMQRSSVADVLPAVDKVLDFAVAVRKKLGLEQ